MNYGLRRLRDLGVRPKQIRATGGGAGNRMPYTRFMADIFEQEVVTVKVSEGVRAYMPLCKPLGAWRLHKHDRVGIHDITSQFVKVNLGKRDGDAEQGRRPRLPRTSSHPGRNVRIPAASLHSNT